MKELGFFPNWSFQHPRSLELAEKIAEIAPGDLSSTFFVSSGSEAVETVIKLARQYHNSIGERAPVQDDLRKIAYHGTTMGALSVTGIPASRCLSSRFAGLHPRKEHPAGPRGSGGRHRADHRDRAAGDCGGRHPGAGAERRRVPRSAPEYWKRVREICDRHGVLLVSDAVICAFGRLGEWFGIERFDVVPDMSTFAKGVTSGYCRWAA